MAVACSISVAQLEQLFTHFAEANRDAKPNSKAEQTEGLNAEKLNAEQRRREASVLAKQLAEMQQTMLDAIPNVRHDTKQRLRQSADLVGELGQSDGQCTWPN